MTYLRSDRHHLAEVRSSHKRKRSRMYSMHESSIFDKPIESFDRL